MGKNDRNTEAAKGLPPYFLQFMEDGLPVLKGADISKDILQDIAGIKGILTHPVTGVGIGANGDDFAPQFFEPAEDVSSGKESTAAVHTAGIHFQSLSLFGKNPENLINDLPVFPIRQGPGSRVTFGFADVGQMGQHVKILMKHYTLQCGFQTAPLRLEYGLSAPEGLKVYIQIIHKMDRTQHKLKVPPLQIFFELLQNSYRMKLLLM